jgi:ABC-type multidrug transport system fused ATPase/permease subunit
LLNKKKIVLVDEATASIDFETNAAIQKVFKTHFTDSTVLTIAHRLDSVKNCDRILVLERGEIKSFDTPLALLGRDSLYQQMVE